ncbi:sulfurtransferase-like selenium metabolism protein YedF [Clostridium botulinum]|uniref:sulfurtransferase-like selenium metabolism protein YedF n=1 Tax=Clostridium botulinum TaxID=1491 RepID=UPI001C9A7E88|nr:sulfurtransferase-like selenium metabolism protein YedF [Clostridium botulinum]MBY6795231.1 sulfurtransferase-like selenium metabolism protein YedF [Clostridium botulinum]MBY6865835.1 sulfurtransferase-like selenium metabolism protein YedF [Clostridium botulinum]HDI3055257.1 sulfurtransferase-like selenium metabolism protein YedF [Clostridium botulinum]
MTKIIDCKGLKCPQPVINTKKYFDSIEKGQATTIVDNEVAKNNIIKLAEKNGFKSEVEENDSLYYITITKEHCVACETILSNEKKLVMVISKNVLGGGDDKLGTALMKSYLYALSESDSLPSHLLFLNGGVKLTIEDSECLESIQSLKDKGVTILSCGTCLDFYGIKSKLKVGEITNMYTIVEEMTSADNTIFI